MSFPKGFCREFRASVLAKLTGRHHSVMGKVEQARRKIEIVEFVEYCDLLEVDPHEGLKVLVDSLRKSAPKKTT